MPDLLPWIFTICCLVGFVVSKIKQKHGYWARKGVDFVPPKLLSGNLSIINSKSWVESFTDLYESYPNARYIGVYQFFKPALIIRDPDLIKRITLKDFDHFMDHMTFASPEVDPIWNRNLFASSGDRWRDLRSTLSPCFTGSKIKTMCGFVEEAAQQFVRHICGKSEGKSKAGNEIVEVEMKNLASRFAADIIASTAFGIECNSLANGGDEFFLKGEELADLSGLRALRFFAYSISPKLSTLFKIKIIPTYLSNYFTKIIEDTLTLRKERNIVRADMIHLLLEAQKSRKTAHQDSKEVKEPITNEDIIAQAVVFFLAGFDTVSSELSFLFYELALNPDIQSRLREELNSVNSVNYETVSNFKYLDCVISETLRKWPAGILHDRNVTKKYCIEAERPGEVDLHLEEGTVIWFSTYSIHRDARFYPNPESFDPERFNEENKSKINPMTYMPFGLGPRNCIGSRFALLEMKLLTYYVLKTFEVVPVKKTNIPMVLDKDKFALASKGGMWLGFKKIVE